MASWATEPGIALLVMLLAPFEFLGLALGNLAFVAADMPQVAVAAQIRCAAWAVFCFVAGDDLHGQRMAGQPDLARAGHGWR